MERKIEQAHPLFVEQRLALPRRATLAAWAAFLAAAAIAWGVLLFYSRGMAMPAMMPLPAFLVFWTVMMVAMMFPSVAPTAMLWIGGIARSSPGASRAWRLSAFTAGYLAVWTAFGVGAYFALLSARALLERAPHQAGWAGAAIFLFAAVYQCTPLKRACLLHCRSPFAAMVHYAQFPARGRDALVGLHHGAYCVGCCWGLMALLLAAGVMNVPAMAAVAALIFLEKRWTRGPALAGFSGLLFLVFAVAAAMRPEVFPGLR